jgi:hypothetical protein
MLAFAACGTDVVENDVLIDTNVNDVTVDVPAEDVPVGTDVVDATDVTVDPDVTDVVGDTVDPDVTQMVDRYFTFRTIGGISMGAAALTVASHYPDMFDGVGALGGYVDYRYIGHLIRDMMGSGFCPMDQILQVAADDLANGTNELNNMDNPLVDCSITPNKDDLRPYEVYMTYNKMKYAEQGGTTFDRSFMFDVLGALVYAFGNFLFYNPEHPMLPPGVDIAWLDQTDSQKCANPSHVTFPNNINAEFNPAGEFDLITFCDGDPDVCRGVDNCDESDPATRDKKGWYFPDQIDRHTDPVAVFLAVDYNGNGMRDYGEPVVFNMAERWSDVGVDGCTNEFENGTGGCNGTATGSATVDANGDDWHLLTNPGGTEKNSEYDDPEPYEDFGVDGVDATTLTVPDDMTVEQLKDYGEGDGKYTNNPRWDWAINNDARSFFKKTPLEDLNKHSYFFDGGIHDGLGALTAAYHLAKNLEMRGAEVKYYQNFVGQEDSVFPDQTCSTIVLGDEAGFGSRDLSVKGFGKNFLIAYGDPTLSDEEAYQAGSGNHIGNGCEVTMRATVPYSASNFRMPDAIIGMTNESMGDMRYSSYYSDILKSRRWFSITLPPDYASTDCYKNCDAADPEDKVLVNELEYPISFLLPGIGMPLDATSALTYLFNATMMLGTSPRYIVVVPDGQCCYRTKDTGEQVCNCFRNGPVMTCVDNECTGKHSDCTVTDIPRGEFSQNHEQECNSGHFFVNQATNKFGATGADIETMKFEDALIENILYLETEYRIRKPATVSVPVDF